jgi:hypothetical protein
MFKENSINFNKKKEVDEEKVAEQKKEKKIAYTSDLAYFHNQKQGNFDPETGVIYGVGTENYKKYLRFKKYKEVEKNIGTVGEQQERIESVINILEKAELEDDYKNDEDQIKLLQEKITKAKEMISSVMEKAGRYVEARAEVGRVSLNKDKMERDEYKDESGSADLERRSIHNALISVISMTNKFIRFNFGNIDEKDLEQYKEIKKKNNNQELHVKKVDLPKNIICTDSVNLKDRESIAGNTSGQYYIKVYKKTGIFPVLKNKNYNLFIELRVRY